LHVAREVCRDSLLSFVRVAGKYGVGAHVNSYGSKTYKTPRRNLLSVEDCDNVMKHIISKITKVYKMHKECYIPVSVLIIGDDVVDERRVVLEKGVE